MLRRGEFMNNQRIISLLLKIDEMGGLNQNEFEELIKLLEKKVKELKESLKIQKQ